MTSQLKSRPLPSRPLVLMPPQNRLEADQCASLTTVAGIGLVGCSHKAGHECERPHQEIDESTDEVLTEWLPTSPPTELISTSGIRKVA